jgi:hypothetical protein
MKEKESLLFGRNWKSREGRSVPVINVSVLRRFRVSGSIILRIRLFKVGLSHNCKKREPCYKTERVLEVISKLLCCKE